jgi:hypothetical protein
MYNTQILKRHLKFASNAAARSERVFFSKSSALAGERTIENDAYQNKHGRLNLLPAEWVVVCFASESAFCSWKTLREAAVWREQQFAMICICFQHLKTYFCMVKIFLWNSSSVTFNRRAHDNSLKSEIIKHAQIRFS